MAYPGAKLIDSLAFRNSLAHHDRAEVANNLATAMSTTAIRPFAYLSVIENLTRSLIVNDTRTSEILRFATGHSKSLLPPPPPPLLIM